MRLNFTRLNKKILTLGVPLMALLMEMFVAILFLFILSIKWFIVIPVVILLHILIASLYRYSTNFMNEISFLAILPYRRFYKKGSVYLPTLNEIKRGY